MDRRRNCRANSLTVDLDSHPTHHVLWRETPSAQDRLRNSLLKTYEAPERQVEQAITSYVGTAPDLAVGAFTIRHPDDGRLFAPKT
jgi:hypothetical protein